MTTLVLEATASDLSALERKTLQNTLDELPSLRVGDEFKAVRLMDLEGVKFFDVTFAIEARYSTSEGIFVVGGGFRVELRSLQTELLELLHGA